MIDKLEGRFITSGLTELSSSPVPLAPSPRHSPFVDAKVTSAAQMPPLEGRGACRCTSSLTSVLPDATRPIDQLLGRAAH